MGEVEEFQLTKLSVGQESRVELPPKNHNKQQQEHKTFRLHEEKALVSRAGSGRTL